MVSSPLNKNLVKFCLVYIFKIDRYCNTNIITTLKLKDVGPRPDLSRKYVKLNIFNLLSVVKY